MRPGPGRRMRRPAGARMRAPERFLGGMGAPEMPGRIGTLSRNFVISKFLDKVRSLGLGGVHPRVNFVRFTDEPSSPGDCEAASGGARSGCAGARRAE